MEQHRQGKQDDTCQQQRTKRKDQFRHKDRPGQICPDICRRHNSASQVQRGIILRVLDRMSALMGGHAYRSDRSAVIDVLGQRQLFASGIIMVREAACNRYDPYIIDTRRPQEPFRSLRSG